MLRLLVSGGGTAGGVYPGLAVVAALGERAEALWIGGEGGMEADLVGSAGVEFTAIPAAGLHGVGLARLPSNALRLMQGCLAARPLVRAYAPEALFLTGGYVGVPVALAARELPIMSYVPDLEPALALRWINRMADLIAVTAEPTLQLLPKGRPGIVSGYPTRPGLKALSKPEALHRLGLSPELPVILIFGGSRGARSINQAVWANLEELLELTQVLHITGQLDWPRSAARSESIPDGLRPRYQAHPYLHEGMGWALAAADLAVSRAGAAVLGEFPLFGLPSILVPYPHAWRYQRTNADYMRARGAAEILPNERLEDGLVPSVRELLGDEEKRKRMSAAASVMAKPDAAHKIADALLEMGKLARG